MRYCKSLCCNWNHRIEARRQYNYILQCWSKVTSVLKLNIQWHYSFKNEGEIKGYQTNKNWESRHTLRERQETSFSQKKLDCRWKHQFRTVRSLSHVRLFVTPWTAAHQASLSITNSRSSPKFMTIESVMPSNHLILCHPLFLLPPIPPSISLFQWVNSSHEVAKVLEFQL